MNNWKTTVCGILAFAPQFVGALGMAIPEPISKLILAVFGVAGFFLAQDKDKAAG